MPPLDVSDVLLDPDFTDTSLMCHRQIQTVDEDSFAKGTVQDIPSSGAVTVDCSLEARQMEAGQNISDAILIVAQFRLTQGQPSADDTSRLDADVVTYNRHNYHVTFVDPYTSYSTGFAQAHYELVDFNEGTSVE